MKGVILAGGTGSRLYPLTKVTNKHLLPVYDKPMIYYPLECMAKAGIDEVLLVTGGNNSGDFLRLLGNGHEFGFKNLNYTYQDGAGGIARHIAAEGFHPPGDPRIEAVGGMSDPDHQESQSRQGPHVRRSLRVASRLQLMRQPGCALRRVSKPCSETRV